MSSALLGSEHVYTGVWIDHTRGDFQGLSLTTTARQGIYLIAILALDALHQQYQALLRSEGSDTAAVLRFVEVSWAWRSRSKHALLRGLPFILGGLLHCVAFAAAGIFSTRVVSPHSDVLLRGSTCGLWQVDFNSSSSGYLLEQARYGQWLKSNWRAGEKFVDNCYDFDSGVKNLTSDCLAAGKGLIPWTVQNTSCPFEDHMCKDGKAVRLDSGPIDSLYALGINSSPKDRMTMRVVHECAPLVTDGYFEDFTNPNQSVETAAFAHAVTHYGRDPKDIYTGFLYGNSTEPSMNYTWVYYGNHSFGQGMGPIENQFLLYSAYSFAGRDTANFVPLPSLNRTDGDVAIVFVANRDIGYLEPSHDPIFGATTPRTLLEPMNGVPTNVTFYYGRASGNALGCVQRFEWCNPAHGPHNCSGLVPEGWGQWGSLRLNGRQAQIIVRLTNVLARADFWDMVVELGSEGLLATSNLGDGYGAAAPPDDQWARELSHWFGTHLSVAQSIVAKYPTGTGNPNIDRYFERPTNVNATWMCDSQIIQRDDYYTFNMVGMLLILVGGGLVIITNIIVMCCVQQTWRIGSEKKTGFQDSAWRLYDQLQLQSRVYQAMNLGDWNESTSIPVTEKDMEIFPPPVFGDHGFASDVELADVPLYDKTRSSLLMFADGQVGHVGIAR